MKPGTKNSYNSLSDISVGNKNYKYYSLKKAEQNQIELFGGEESSDEEDLIPAELLDDFEEYSREEYEVEKIIDDTYSDLDQLVVFLSELLLLIDLH